jgi:hypothetical protein
VSGTPSSAARAVLLALLAIAPAFTAGAQAQSAVEPQRAEERRDMSDAAAIAACGGRAERRGRTLAIRTDQPHLPPEARWKEFVDLVDQDGEPLIAPRLVLCEVARRYALVRVFQPELDELFLVDWLSGRHFAVDNADFFFRHGDRAFIVVERPVDGGPAAGIQYIRHSPGHGWQPVWRFVSGAQEQEFLGWVNDEAFRMRFVWSETGYGPGGGNTLLFRIQPIGFSAVID